MFSMVVCCTRGQGTQVADTVVSPTSITAGPAGNQTPTDTNEPYSYVRLIPSTVNSAGLTPASYQ
jgi:hypothetical protein